MTPKDWHTRYIERLVTKGQFTHREARGMLKDRMGHYDYDDSPEDEADTEIWFWKDWKEEVR